MPRSTVLNWTDDRTQVGATAWRAGTLNLDGGTLESEKMTYYEEYEKGETRMGRSWYAYFHSEGENT
jgi:hypothetical protein